MKAIILCAGQSTRTRPLTLTRPKPLLYLGEKTLLEHNLDQLRGIVTAVTLVVGYKADMIQTALGTIYKDLSITYVTQTEQKGTGHALLQIPFTEPTLVLMGDDFYMHDDLKRLAQHNASILGMQVEHPQRFGIITHDNFKLMTLEEKPEHPKSNLANAAAYVLPVTIQTILETLTLSERGELELTTAVQTLAAQQLVTVVEATTWCPIAYPQDLITAMRILHPDGYIDETAYVTGCAVNSIICKNSTVEGEVLDSIVFPDCTVDAASRIEHSVLGEHVTLTKTTLTNTIVADHTTLTDAEGETATIDPNLSLTGKLQGDVHE